MGKQSIRALALAAFWFAPLGVTLSAQEDSDIEWLGDLNQATELAMESGRPLLIVFR